ncbi:MAG: methyltransferase family protein [Candidatus Acidiferrales bacterium]
MRWRVRLGYPLALIFWLLAAPSARSILVGSLIAAIGLFIRGAAAGYLRKDRELATSGPYALTRNPLYLGSAFLAAGFVVAGSSWPAAVIVSLYFAIFYYRVMRSEEEDLRSKFGAAFTQYAAHVPLFFPFWVGSRYVAGTMGKTSEKFSWEQYRRNREYQALLGALGGLAALALRAWIRMRFRY